MKSILSFLIICLTLEPTVFGNSTGGDGDGKNVTSRIYRGYQIKIEDAPWMVYVRYKTYNEYGARVDIFCGGTIVNEMYILTAGHCTVDNVQNTYKAKKAELYEIRVGSTYFNKGGTLYYVDQVNPHPGYTPASPAHDVGLLKLTKKIVYNKKTVQNVRLDTSKGMYKGGEDVWSMGWGANPENPHAPELYEVALHIVDSAECARLWGGSASEYKRAEVCAIGPKDASVCSGDSGGPLLYGENNIQIGVASFAAGCGENYRHLPPAFAKIADNMDWIIGVVSDKHDEEQGDC